MVFMNFLFRLRQSTFHQLVVGRRASWTLESRFIQHLWEYILCTSINIRKTMDTPRLEHVKIPYHQRYGVEETTETSVNSFSQSCQPSAEWIILYRRSCSLSKSSGRNSN